MMFAIVSRGRNSEIRLVPHRYEDDRYHVSLTKEGPHIPLFDVRDIPCYLENGYSLGMSNKEKRPRPILITPKSIRGWK